MSACTKIIAELHSAGLSNEKIGYLLAQHGGKERTEGAVRGWAMGGPEPRASDWDALKALHAEVFHAKLSQESAIELQQPCA